MSKNLMSYDDAETILTGYANEIKANQDKTLSSPIVVDGTSCTTVEDAIEALVELLDPKPAVLTLGETYTFGNNGGMNIQWICAESGDGYYVLQSTGVTGGTWPGYKMTGPSSGTGDWGSANDYYSQDIDGADIYTYDSKMSTLYNLIKNAEKTDASYGKGLFLVGTDKIGTDTNYSDATEAQKLYRNGLKEAANDYELWGANSYYSWISSSFAYNVQSARSVVKTGNLGVNNQGTTYVIAPAFNLDPLKVTVDANNVITLKE